MLCIFNKTLGSTDETSVQVCLEFKFLCNINVLRFESVLDSTSFFQI